uniref:Wiskott-Aldrich syndrome protein family member 3-like isoform X2 n=1 Tax=Diabrotica virgifera virgifera TaxID=50390 RepID=A0A6P7G811_DIAVI
MPFVQRFVEPKFLSRTQLFDENGHPKIGDYELEAVNNNTLCNALRQLASLVLAANDIFEDLGGQLEGIGKRSEVLRVRITNVGGKVEKFDPKEVTVRKYPDLFSHKFWRCGE